jgi:hypothetical protein
VAGVRTLAQAVMNNTASTITPVKNFFIMHPRFTTDFITIESL